VGRLVIVTGTVVDPVQLFDEVVTTVYVVLTVGLTVTVEPEVGVIPNEGLHVKLIPNVLVAVSTCEFATHIVTLPGVTETIGFG
jgi:hypothetical protein